MNVQKVTVNCEKHGDYEANQMDIYGKAITTTKCPKCAVEHLEETKRKEREANEAAQKLRIETSVNNFERCIPARFKHATLENYMADTPQKQEKLSAFQRYSAAFGNKIQETGGGLILTGNPGTGKTHLSIGLGRELASVGWHVAYVNLTNLIRRIRSTWTDETQSEDEIIRRLQDLNLLIIDEVGAQTGSDNERNIIFEIVNGRYEQVKPTIIISNYSVKEVADFISERSVDRITQGGAVLNFTWESHRGAV